MENQCVAMSLGADGVQIGSRFVASVESSAYINFKDEVVKAKRGRYTIFSLKKLTAVRLLNNDFYQQVKKRRR